jgi:guanosine-3',5'-bis(diphosphate) 3'-pyrophosphohydrolase
LIDYEKVVKEIISSVRKEHGEESAQLVKKAYEFAKKAHEGQKRESGSPYICHPVSVAKIVFDLGMDPETLCGAFLHDVVEDTDVSLEEIKKEFGDEIGLIVDGLTKIQSLEKEDVKFSEIETIRKMIFAMAQDVRVVIVKLADRLHNMRTLKTFGDEERRKEKAKQTLEVYAPIANRLGIYTIKSELEDLSFKYVYPTEYKRIKELVDKKINERTEEIAYYKKELETALKKGKVNFIEVDGRAKHFYSIWKKMKSKNKEFSEVYDLFALRVLVKDIPHCYTSLGVVHNLWRPIPGRFKDYIASPKSNGYRSLHTSVMTEKGEVLEIQIRDEEMHREAEIGMAAHWKYKEGRVKNSEWIDRLFEWQKNYVKGLSNWKELTKELQLDDVFVFTPEGEVKRLPKGSTPIDFAYMIHTEIGNHYVGAIVNGRMVPIGHKLRNGDRIRILVDKNSSGPSLDWLRYAKSSRTKAKIKKFLRDKYAEEYVSHGQEILREIVKKYHISLEEFFKMEKVKRYFETHHIESERELKLRLGEGAITSFQIENLLEEKKVKEIPAQHLKKAEGKEILIEDLDGIEFHLAKCCRPVPGDPIIGVITRNHGISVHRADCKNLKNFDKGRLVKVSWGMESGELFSVGIGLKAYDHEGLLGDIINRIREKHVQLAGVTSRVDDVGIAHISIAINVSDLKQLKDVMSHIKKEKGVLEVHRERGGTSESGRTAG